MHCIGNCIGTAYQERLHADPHPDRTLTGTARRALCRAHARLLPARAHVGARMRARQQGEPLHRGGSRQAMLAQGLVEARRQRGFFVRDFVQKQF